MSEFTEKLNSSELVSNAWDEIDRDKANAGLLIDTISNEFKDWKPPKQLVEVPQIVADWFENQLKNNESKKFDGNDVFRIIQDVIKVSNGESTWGDYDITDEIAKFAEDNEELFLNLIVNCSLGYGYTVEKEKLFYLKSKMTGRYLRSYTGLGMDDTTLRYEEVDDRRACGFGGGTTFTQSEIDKMNTGSYEQIPVEMSDEKKKLKRYNHERPRN